MKACTRCGQTKALNAFSPDKRTSDGRQSRCKACQAELRKEWRASNPERAAAEMAAFRAANPNYYREYYESNRDSESARKAAAYRADAKVRERLRKYQEKKPHIRTAITAKRRAVLACAVPPWADSRAIAEKYAEAKRLSLETGIQHEVDHIVPLQGRTVCGLHWHENLCVLPMADNRAKSNRHWQDQPQCN